MTIVNEEQAREYVEGLCSPNRFEILQRFVDLLLEENELQNLVATASVASIWRRHIADSAQIGRFLPANGSVTDFGSGPGLPGMVLAIIRPDLRFYLVESRKLRVEWLSRISQFLQLSNVTVAGANVSTLEPWSTEGITARAFAPLSRLLTLVAPFSTDETQWVLPKGASAAQELSGLAAKQRKMFHVEQSLTDPEAGIIVGIGKIEARS